MSAQSAATATLGAPTVPSVARLFTHPTLDTKSVHRYPVRFTGDGGAYFRIWLRTTLLTLVTLGLYWPWAQAQRLQYIYSHIQVAEHALAFTGQPKRMLRAYAMLGALLLCIVLARGAGSLTSTVAGLTMLLMVPAFMQGTMQFKLAHTRWQGQPFQFNGTIWDAYKLAATPIGILLAVLALSVTLAIMFSQGDARTAGTIAATPMVLCAYALIPYVWWQVKHYQHQNYAFGALQTHFRASAGSVVKVFIKSALVSVVSVLIAAGVFGILVGLSLSSLPAGNATSTAHATGSLLPWLAVFAGLSQVVPFAFFTSRMQNLIWTNTGNQSVRFKSQLGFKPVLALLIKNMTLTAVTLGLYAPYARMAWLRMRLEAITVHSRVMPSQLRAQPLAN